MGAIAAYVATLAFIGFSSGEGYADWGQLIALSRGDIFMSTISPLKYWWSAYIPTIFTFTYALGWNLVGEKLRDLLDPLYKRKMIHKTN